MEKQLNSSGIFSQEFRHCRFFRKSRMICESEECTDQIIFMSIFNEIDWTKKETQGICIFEFRHSQGIREEILARTLDLSWSWRRKEVVWNSSLHIYSHSDGGSDSKVQVIQYSRVLVLWVVEFWKRRMAGTPHFNADASNTELLFRIIHSVNQLSIYGAVASWCEQFVLTEEEKGQEKQKEAVTKGVLTSVKITRSTAFGFFSKTSLWKQFWQEFTRIPTCVVLKIAPGGA